MALVQKLELVFCPIRILKELNDESFNISAVLAFRFSIFIKLLLVVMNVLKKEIWCLARSYC